MKKIFLLFSLISCFSFVLAGNPKKTKGTSPDTVSTSKYLTDNFMFVREVTIGELKSFFSKYKDTAHTLVTNANVTIAEWDNYELNILGKKIHAKFEFIFCDSILISYNLYFKTSNEAAPVIKFFTKNYGAPTSLSNRKKLLMWDGKNGSIILEENVKNYSTVFSFLGKTPSITGKK